MTIRPEQVCRSEQKLASVSYRVAQQHLEAGGPKMWSYHMSLQAEHSQTARRILFVMLGDDPMSPELDHV